MSVTVTINGVNQTIPSQGDEGWANYTTTTLVALAQAVFPKTGGNFFITGDLNFGSMFGIIAKYFVSSSTPVASSGVIKLANFDTINWRNHAGNADDILSVNSTDQLLFNGVILAEAANPVATYGVNLTGTNGTSVNSLRSDVVLKLDPSISPTWTGTHEFGQTVQMDNALNVTNEITCGEINTTSDATLKQDIKNIEDPLEKIFALNGVHFKWKSDGVKSVGLIAQDVEKIFPELVNEFNGTKHLNYNGVIGLLLECVKELTLEVELLKRGQYGN